MPWLETAPMDERLQFIQDALSDRFNMRALRPVRHQPPDRVQVARAVRRGGTARTPGP